MSQFRNKISILGSGAWANTLACHFARNFDILMWDYRAERVKIISQTRQFDRPKEGIFPDSINFTADLKEAINFSDYIFSVVPMKGILELSHKIKDLSRNQSYSAHKEEKKIIINCSKGIEIEALKTPSEIFAENLDDFQIASLSGPNLALEVLAGQPMISSIASPKLDLSQGLQRLFSDERLRLYASDDLLGVEFCGAVKNVIAIAAGASDGLGFGASTKASLITRALNEMKELIKVKGCTEETLYTAAGLGDLIATCNSELSRNYRVGYFLAQNYSLDEIYQKINASTEGVSTAFALKKLANSENLRIPICLEVADMLSGSKNPAQAVNSLMSRKIN